MIEAFLFDIGNVLVTVHFSRAMNRLAARSDLRADEICGRLTPLIGEMECGKFGSREFVRRGAAATRFAGTPEEFIAAYTEIFDENPPMSRLVAALAERFPLYLLSNTSGLHLDYLRAIDPVFAHFRGGVFSYLAASLKPDEKIFREAIAQCRLDPGRTLYLDDGAANTAVAARLGFQTFTYDWRRHDDFVEFLRPVHAG
jgi:glucose-1-phosphatase